MKELDAKGVAVAIEASHSCMTVRGVHKTAAHSSRAAMRDVQGTARDPLRGPVVDFRRELGREPPVRYPPEHSLRPSRVMLIPMLADFAVRVAGGLAVLLLATPWRLVPPGFFRTHCQIILALLVLGVLDRDALEHLFGAILATLIASAVFGYLATVAWGLGLPRLAVPITTLIVLAVAGVLIVWSRTPAPEIWALNACGRLASAFLLGSTLTAMLLGHYYLTSPAMSIDPLRRFVVCTAWGLAIRALVAAVGLGFWLNGRGLSHTSATVPPLFLAVRWGMGLVAPAVATVLTWKTVQIRSTQSATGILYIAFTLILIGELSALILSRDVGVVF